VSLVVVLIAGGGWLAAPEHGTGGERTCRSAQIQAIRAAMRTVTDSDVKELHQRLLADRNYKWELLQKDRRDLLPLLLMALRKHPQMMPLWSHIICSACASPDRPKRLLSGEAQALQGQNMACLQEALRLAKAAIRQHPQLKEPDVALNSLRHCLANAMLAAGDDDLATIRRLASEMLRSDVSPESWDYANVFHRAHTILGRVSLREGDLEEARVHLLESAKIRGSPQLNSFGPSFMLAGELLDQGKRCTTLAYLELVARFWANESAGKSLLHKKLAREHADLLSEWQDRIRAGERPEHAKWGTYRTK
jgi:hypothetical protein